MGVRRDQMSWPEDLDPSVIMIAQVQEEQTDDDCSLHVIHLFSEPNPVLMPAFCSAPVACHPLQWKWVCCWRISKWFTSNHYSWEFSSELILQTRNMRYWMVLWNCSQVFNCVLRNLMLQLPPSIDCQWLDLSAGIFFFFFILFLVQWRRKYQEPLSMCLVTFKVPTCGAHSGDTQPNYINLDHWIKVVLAVSALMPCHSVLGWFCVLVFPFPSKLQVPPCWSFLCFWFLFLFKSGWTTYQIDLLINSEDWQK